MAQSKLKKFRLQAILQSQLKAVKMKITPFMIILIFAFVVGCTASSTSKPKEIDVFVGVQGLAAEFAKTAPPPRVFESSSFPILLKVSNKGAYSVSDKKGVISIGMEKDYVNGLNVQQGDTTYSWDDTNQIYYDISGKTQINPKGDEILIPMSAKTGKLDPQRETRTSTITATLCYPYKTTLSTTVCIDPDAAGIRPGKKVCNVKEIAFSSGQGAPIAVTKIEPQMIPELDQDIVKPQFLIFIENKGLGNSVDINNYHNVCGKSDFGDGTAGSRDIKNIWNVAFLRAYSSGNKQLICCPNLEGKCDETGNDPVKMTGFVRFRDKKDFVRCTLKDGEKKNSDAYTSPLRVEIDYGYVQTFTSNFIIQKPLKY